MEINKRLSKLLGWTTLIVLSLIPVALWFSFGAGLSEMTNYGDTIHSLGELFGLVGMTMFALTFVLSTRIKFIEDIFGGLDKVYIVHGILGGTALILILFHPIFLVLKFIPAQLGLAAEYLLPSNYWSVNFGIIALFGLIILIYITLFTKMKYHRWKFTHEFLGIVFAIAVLHIFLVRGSVSVDNIFRGYYIYSAAVSIIGLGAFSYSLFLKNRIIKNAVYKIESIEQKNKDYFEIFLVPEHKPVSYTSGQFVFMRFYNEKLSKEPHPFSIASKSNDYKMKIVIKKLGDFTDKLEYLKIGDKVSIEGPYGRFSFHGSGKKSQVWIAAGVGITPFLGMVEDLEDKKNMNFNIDLYYTVSDSSDFVGYHMLEGIHKKNKKFRFIPWNSSEKGRIKVSDIFGISGDLINKEFLLCGPEKFKEDIIISLINQGVKKSNIHEEIFDFR